jgi:hypothetical protein
MRKLKVVIFAAAFALVCCGAVFAAGGSLDKAVSDGAAFMYRTVKNPQVGSMGGEWAVIGLARSGYDAPDTYYENYYRNVEAYVKEYNGVLHEKKYTEYSRVILGLTAAGYDPRSVAGYDLTAPLGDFERTVWQGVNGPIWALIALDSMNYPIPDNPGARIQATRELYVAEILRRQISDGGFNLTAGADGEIGANEKGDPDITGMALQALAKYQDDPKVKDATEKALQFLSKSQDDKGGYSSWGSKNSESVVQVLVALCELGISADDPRFVKNGQSLIDSLLTYQNGDGGFKHTYEGTGESQMSSEQALYGLAAAQRARNGKNSLYRMSDVVKRVDFAPTVAAGAGLPGKNADVAVPPVSRPGKTFEDIRNHTGKDAVEALASRGVVGGKTEDRFDPGATVTRAEFAAMVTRGLGLPERGTNVFEDVAQGQWYAKSVATAYYYKIISGVTDTAFNPGGLITRQEAAVMTARAAKLCGMDIARSETEIRDTLAQFGDYRTAASWAQSALAFCYGEGILDDSVLDIRPVEPVTRAEVAEMLHRMLNGAKLL